METNCAKAVCTGVPPLCSICVEATLTRALRGEVRRRAFRWGRSVYARRPGATWPHWDADATGRLRATAVHLVCDLHTDVVVLDRLARSCAYQGGEAYREEERQAAIRAR